MFLAVFLALTVLLGTAAPAIGATADELAYSGDAPAPNPHIKDDLTVAAHEMSWGASHEAMRYYYDDQGEKTLGKFVVNTSWDLEDGSGNPNPYSFTVTDVEDDDLGAFPRVGSDEEENSASALDATEWSTSGANSANLTVSDTQTGPNVEAVRIDTDGTMGAGDVATASYANWTSELDTDESKRVLMLAADVDELDAGTEVTINVTDESGDVKQVVINSSRNYGDDDVLANATGEGYVLQVKLSTLTTIGGGSFDNIESIDVTVRDGDVDVSFAWIDLEKKGVIDLVEQRHDDDDSDDDWDNKKTLDTGFSGAVSTYSMTTLPAMWDDATIHGVSYPVKWQASLLVEQGADAEYQVVEDSADAYVGFDTIGNISYRLEVPDAIDLTHSNLKLVTGQEWPSDRYVELGINEDAGETEFGELSYTDKTGVLVSAPDDDTELTLDSTVSAGTAYALQYRIKLTQSEWSAMSSAGDSTPATSGGGGAVVSVGGLVDFLIGIPGMIIVLVGAGVARIRGWI